MAEETPGIPDRRGTVGRRQYNRRQSDEATAPPYYETFLRIAEALEGIEALLRGRGTVVMPDVQSAEDERTTVARGTEGRPLQER